MSTLSKGEIFNRLYNYLKNYDKTNPTTYPGFLTLPQTKIIMSHYGNDPYKTALGILYNTGKFTDEDIITIDNMRKGLFGKLSNFLWAKPIEMLNKIFNMYPGKYMRESSDAILKVAISEYNPLAESPADVPDYVTNIYLDQAPETALAEINKYLNTTDVDITPDNVYELLETAIMNAQKNIDAEKQRYLQLTPQEFFNQCVEDPDLLNQIASLKDDEFNRLMNAKFNQGQLEHLKSGISYASKSETMDDLYMMDRLECGINDEPLWRQCGINDDPSWEKLPDSLNYDSKNNIRNIILESFQNTANENQVKLETETSLAESLNQPMNNITQSNNDLLKILAGAGGIALLGGGAYAGYRWWQNHKLQQEREKQRELELNELRRQQNKNQSRKRQTVINNIVHTKPVDLEF